MPVTRDIAETYRGPGNVMRRLLAGGPREDRALMFLMTGCIVVFIAQMPRLARQAHLTGQDLDMLMGASLLAWVFLAPLMFYGLAGASHLVFRIFGGKGTWYGARLALFWSLLASSPLLLLHGLVAGFIGQGPQLKLVGAVWLVVFLWFWVMCLLRAERDVE